MRFTVVLGVILGIGLAGFAGCGSGRSTDPKDLKPLDAQDIEEIRKKDAEVEADEKTGGR